MKYSSSFLFYALSQVALADSDSFILQVMKSGSAIQDAGIAQDASGNLVINGQPALQAVITDESLLKVGDLYLTSGPNETTLLQSDPSRAAQGFAIQNGIVVINSGFFASPDGSNFDVKLGSIALPSGDTTDIPFNIQALAVSGSNSVADFTPSSNGPAPADASPAQTTVISPPIPGQGDSPVFIIQIIRSGSPIQFAGVSVENNNLVINGQPGAEALITAEGQLKVGTQFLSSGPNSQITLTNDASQAVSGFSVENSFVTGGPGFFATKNGNEFDLFFGTSSDPNNIPFAIKALTENGSSTLNSFSPGSSISGADSQSSSQSMVSSSTESAAMSSSQTASSTESAAMSSSQTASSTPITADTAFTTSPSTQSTESSFVTTEASESTPSSTMMIANANTTMTTVSTSSALSTTMTQSNSLVNTKLGNSTLGNSTTLSTATHNSSTSMTSVHPKNGAVVRSVNLGAGIAAAIALLI